MINKSYFIPAVAVLFFLFAPEAGHALTSDQVLEKVKSAIVAIESVDAFGKAKSHGSGVVLPSGKIATNCDVVREGTSYRVTQEKQTVYATLKAADSDRDICLLEADAIKTAKPAQLGRTSALKAGMRIYAVGVPQGLKAFNSEGTISQLKGDTAPFIQTTATVFPGSSGGGLFDENGRLIGITSLYIEDNLHLCFAMPVEWIDEVKPQGGALTGSNDGLTWPFGQNRAGRRQSVTIDNKAGQTLWIKRAVVLEEKKDWKGLLEWSKKWTETKPESKLAWDSLGTAYVKLNRDNDAVEVFKQALRLNPSAADSWCNLAGLFGKLGRFNEAVEAYRQALRINPENADGWNSLGVTYCKLNRHEDAIKSFKQSLRIDEDYTNAWNNLGSVYGILNRHADALDAYKQVIHINPNDAKAWYNIGSTYYKTNRRGDAIEAYKQAIRVNPDYANAWYNLGHAYGELKRYNDAIEAYRQALRINPEHASAWYNIGIVYGQLNRNEDAIDAYREALRINPDYASAWYNLGGTYAMAGNRSAALGAFRELRKINPTEADKLFNMIVPK